MLQGVVMVGFYKGIEYRKHRICDVLDSPIKAKWLFVYAEGKPTGDHFRTLAEVKRYIEKMG